MHPGLLPTDDSVPSDSGGGGKQKEVLRGAETFWGGALAGWVYSHQKASYSIKQSHVLEC